MFNYKRCCLLFFIAIVSGCSLDLTEQGEMTRQRAYSQTNIGNKSCQDLGGKIEIKEGVFYCLLPSKELALFK